jgi:DNA-3-methyladenine glycosylase II
MLEHIKHLNKDKKLKAIISTQETIVLKKEKNIYLWICFSIISQQLSTKVAKVIQQRFLDLFDSKKPSLEEIIATPFDTLKGIGLSQSKTNYLLNVCHFFLEHKLTDSKLNKMDDETLIALLIQIKGVGRWTVEMILMFALGREDVFAVDDLGIQQKMCALFDIDKTDKKQMKIKMQEISSPWSPYRTYACRYLWGWKSA